MDGCSEADLCDFDGSVVGDMQLITRGRFVSEKQKGVFLSSEESLSVLLVLDSNTQGNSRLTDITGGNVVVPRVLNIPQQKNYKQEYCEIVFLLSQHHFSSQAVVIVSQERITDSFLRIMLMHQRYCCERQASALQVLVFRLSTLHRTRKQYISPILWIEYVYIFVRRRISSQIQHDHTSRKC